MHFYGARMKSKPESNSSHLQSLERQLSRAQKTRRPAPPRPPSPSPSFSLVYRDSALFYALLDADCQWGTAALSGGRGHLSSLRGLLGWFGHWHADFCSRQNCRQIVYTGMKLCWPSQARPGRDRQTTEPAQECCCFCACCRCRCLLLRLWLLECA